MEPETVKECIEAVDELIRQKEVEILRARLRKAQLNHVKYKINENQINHQSNNKVFDFKEQQKQMQQQSVEQNSLSDIQENSRESNFTKILEDVSNNIWAEANYL